MESSVAQEAKEIIEKYMGSFSHPSSLNASFNEREQLAEMHKQIELKKAYRDDIRRVNAGLYALKQGMMSRGETDEFAERLVEELNSSVLRLTGVHHEVASGLDKPSLERKILGNSQQVLADQLELQKLQGVLRLQDQLRNKLAGTRIVKQLDREKATVISEEKELTKLEITSNEVMQKHHEMIDRKRREIADMVIRIGEALVQAKELRQKLAKIAKEQHRDDLHDDQGSETDLRSEEGRKDTLGSVVEHDKGSYSSVPLFESIDWNFGSVGMDCQLNLNFKNPNDFPDILTHLSTMNNGKFELKKDKATREPVDEQSKPKDCKRKATPIKTVPNKKEGKQATPPSRATETELAKKRTKSDNNDVIIHILDDEVENVPARQEPQNVDKQREPGVGYVAPNRMVQRAIQKESVTSAAEQPNRRPIRKRSLVVAMPEVKTPLADVSKKSSTSVAPKHTSSIFGGSIKNDAKALDDGNRNVAKQSKKEQQSIHQQPPAPPVNTTNKQTMSNTPNQPKQPSDVPRRRSGRVISPVCNSSPKIGRSASGNSAIHAEPPAMQVDDIGMESSTSNNSLDFVMQSSSGELDINLSAEFQLPDPGDMSDDGLDFLSASPRKAGKDKKAGGENKKKSDDGVGGGMDSFGFDFEESNLAESMDQQDDLF